MGCSISNLGVPIPRSKARAARIVSARATSALADHPGGFPDESGLSVEGGALGTGRYMEPRDRCRLARATLNCTATKTKTTKDAVRIITTVSASVMQCAPAVAKGHTGSTSSAWMPATESFSLSEFWEWPFELASQLPESCALAIRENLRPGKREGQQPVDCERSPGLRFDPPDGRQYRPKCAKLALDSGFARLDASFASLHRAFAWVVAWLARLVTCLAWLVAWLAQVVGALERLDGGLGWVAKKIAVLPLTTRCVVEA